MSKTLFSFVGSQDPRGPDGSDGPILTIHAVNGYDRLILLHTSDDDTVSRAREVREALRDRGCPEVELLSVGIDDPTDYLHLMRVLRELCPPLCSAGGTCHVSIASGAPAMQVCWFMLAGAGELPAKVLYLRRPCYAHRGRPLIIEIDPRKPPFPEIRPRL